MVVGQILEFNEDTNMDSAIIELRENLDMVSSYFPEEIGSPTIMKINPDMMPIVTVSASIEGMSDKESARYIEDKIMPELKSVEGVASVSATGLVQNIIDITLSDEKIKDVNDNVTEFYMKKAMEMANLVKGNMELNMQINPSIPNTNEDNLGSNNQINSNTPIQIEITKELINNILKGQNFAMPLSSINSENGTTKLLRVGDKLEDIKELENLVIMNIPEYGNVKLSDVATMDISDNLSTMYSKVNGNHTIMLAIQKQPNYSTADVANSLNDKMDEISADNNSVNFNILMNQGEYVNVMIGRIVSNLLSGAVLAIAILYIFLRKIRPTLIVGTSIFISVIGAFIVICVFCRGLLVCFTGVLLLFNKITPWYLVTFTFLNSTLEAISMPATVAMLPKILDKEKYSHGIALKSTLSRFAELVGFGVAGILIGSLGTGGTLIVDSTLFILSSIIISTIRYNDKKVEKVIMNIKKYLSDLKEGFTYFKTKDILFTICIFGCIINVIILPTSTLQAAYVSESLSLGVEAISLSGVCMTMGMLIGTAIYPSVSKHISRKKIFNVSWIFLGIFYFSLVGLSSSMPLASFGIVAIAPFFSVNQIYIIFGVLALFVYMLSVYNKKISINFD